MKKQYLSIREVAEEFDCTMQAVHCLLKKRKLPFFRFNSRYKIPIEAVREYKLKSYSEAVND